MRGGIQFSTENTYTRYEQNTHCQLLAICRYGRGRYFLFTKHFTIRHKYLRIFHTTCRHFPCTKIKFENQISSASRRTLRCKSPACFPSLIYAGVSQSKNSNNNNETMKLNIVRSRSNLVYYFVELHF